MTGTDFREFRERLRLTKVRLAELLGVTETTVYRWENDQQPIGKSIVLAMRQIETDLLNEAARAARPAEDLHQDSDK